MQVEDLMTARLMDGPGDGRTMMTPNTNTCIHATFELEDVYEIHRYERFEDSDMFEWVGRKK